MKSEERKIDMFAGAKAGIFARARMLRNNMTKAEWKLWSFLKTKPLGFKFRRQHPFAIYVLDFYCHQAGLSIEVDGPSHDGKIQQVYDIQRTRDILATGVQEIRFTNSAVINSIDQVKFEVLSFLKAVKQD